MKILVITRTGQRAQVKKTLTTDWLRVGRDASCEIHLPDPRIALQQGMIVNRDGLVYLEGEGGSYNITRKSVRSVRLKPGEPVDVGPYRMEAQTPPEGYDGAVSVELVRPLEAARDLASRSSSLTLGSLGITKRWAAWIWGLTVLVIFLAIPAGRVLDLPWRNAAQQLGIGDRFWNPGPVLLAHQPFEKKCATCHEVAFQHVKDRACLECHSAIGQHVAPAMQPATLFEGSRCTTCHRDHKGVKPTHRDNDSFCVGCHRDIRARAKGADAANVSDFARDHPPFRLSLPQETGVKRVRMGAQPIAEKSNLVFPHATHVDPKGIRSPLQGRMTLQCAACHQPDASRRGFEPVSMTKHCQECHALQFEPAVTTREVPHGKAAAAVTVIDEFYANLALRGVRDSFQKAFGAPGEGLLRRVGEPTPDERREALGLASRKAKQVSEELFEVRVCKTCHEVSRAGAFDWKIAPVRANNSWMPHARFDHKSHGQVKCGDCHDVAASKQSADVAMPSIDKCRDCHGGSKPVEGKLTSNCLLCHGFHDPAHPWDPNFRPKAAALK
jgi:predicted CXXCH cytochrome family protein